jgi:CBS domain containing-hemolysin-like protein
MSGVWAYPILIVAAVASLLLSTLSYALREVSRAKLADAVERHRRPEMLDRIYPHATDLAFLTAVGRLLANLCVLLGALHATRRQDLSEPAQYAVALLIAGAITLLVSVAIPHALSENFGAGIISRLSGPLVAARVALLPIIKIAHAFDAVFGKIGGNGSKTEDEAGEEFEAEILSAAEEGEQEGAINAEERRMIERVLSFDDRTVSEAMTSRPNIEALPRTATLDEVRRAVTNSGHSRIPLYEGDLDQVVGVLYARDLIERVGKPGDNFTTDEATRPAVKVHEQMKLSDLLRQLRRQRVHLAIVQDEYGATSGVVTIEDVLEELVGEIADEHEPKEPPLFRKLGPAAGDFDARMHIDDANHVLGLDLPEDDSYDTLAGYVLHRLGHIPQKGHKFDADGASFEVTAAEPHRVIRVTVRRGEA